VHCGVRAAPLEGATVSVEMARPPSTGKRKTQEGWAELCLGW